MRYVVTVTDPTGVFVCAATLGCRDEQTAKQRFQALPLPIGAADLKIGRRVVARRKVQPAPLKNTGS